MKHRCEIGIGLLKEFWGLGIGSVLFEEMFSAAKAHGCRQIELKVIEGNQRVGEAYELGE